MTPTYLFLFVSLSWLTSCLASGSGLARVTRNLAPSNLIYAAVGGSWATGRGLPDSSALHPGDPCERYNASYPILFSSQLRIKRSNFHFIACAADDLFAIIWSQVPFIPIDADLVSISAGLDFIGFGDAVQACDVDADMDACESALNAARYAVYVEDDKSNLFRGMQQLIMAIQQQAPMATIVVLGYPRWLGSPVVACHKHRGPKGEFVSQDQKDKLNALAFEVGAVLLRVAKATSSGGRQVVLVDPDGDWTNHRYCDENREGAWLVPVEAVDKSDSWGSGYYHPNTDGHIELKNLLVRALEQTRPGPKPTVQESPQG